MHEDTNGRTYGHTPPYLRSVMNALALGFRRGWDRSDRGRAWSLRRAGALRRPSNSMSFDFTVVRTLRTYACMTVRHDSTTDERGVRVSDPLLVCANDAGANRVRTCSALYMAHVKHYGRGQ